MAKKKEKRGLKMNYDIKQELVECDVCFDFIPKDDCILDKGFYLCRDCYNATYFPHLNRINNPKEVK